jgi:hypothetical protein
MKIVADNRKKNYNDFVSSKEIWEKKKEFESVTWKYFLK